MWPLWAVSTASRAACLPACLPALRPDSTQLRRMLLLSGAERQLPSDKERLRRNRLRAINFSWRGRCRRPRWRQLSWQNDQQNATFFSGNCCQQQLLFSYSFLHFPACLFLYFLGVFNLPPWLITDRQSRPCSAFFSAYRVVRHTADCTLQHYICHSS